MQTNIELRERFNWQQKSQQNEEQTEKHWVIKDTMKPIQEYTYLYTIVECEDCQDVKASLSFLLSTKIPSFMEKV